MAATATSPMVPGESTCIASAQCRAMDSRDGPGLVSLPNAIRPGAGTSSSSVSSFHHSAFHWMDSVCAAACSCSKLRGSGSSWWS